MGCVKIVCEHNAYLSRVELSESFVGEGLVRIICDQSVSFSKQRSIIFRVGIHSRHT